MKLKDLKNTHNSVYGQIYNCLTRLLMKDLVGRSWNDFKSEKEVIDNLTIEDILTRYDEQELLHMRGFGRKSLEIIKSL